MEQQNVFIPVEEPFDVKKFLFKVLRKWHWFAFSVVLCYSVAFIINRYTEPVYSTSSSLLISDDRKSAVEISMNMLVPVGNRKNIDNEIYTLRSYSLTKKTFDELSDFDINYYTVGRIRKPMLYKTAPFKVVIDSTRQNVKGYPINIEVLSNKTYRMELDGDLDITKVLRFGEPYISDQLNFTIYLKDAKNYSPSSSSKYYFIINDINTLINTYRGKIGVTTTGKGTILTLSSTGYIPQMEVDFLNKFMEVYIRYGLEMKNQTSINTINFIDNQLAMVGDSLHKAENELWHFKVLNKDYDVSAEGKLILDRLGVLQTDKSKIELQLRYFTYLKDYLDKKRDFHDAVAPSVMGFGDMLTGTLIGELTKLQGERKLLSLQAQPVNPGMITINSKIESVTEALQENIKEMIKTTQVSLMDLEKRQQAIDQQMEKLPRTERGFVNVQRGVKINDQIYNFLLQKRADAAIMKASNVPDSKILDYASAENSRQISPQVSRNSMIALIIGILIPLTFLIIFEYFNDRIVDPKDIENNTPVPLLGSIGHNINKSNIPVIDMPKSAISEAFRALRANLHFMKYDKEKMTVCITSSIGGEGKTFTSMNLAANFSQNNKKTILLSLDLRKPRIHKNFNISNSIGISTYLIGRSTYEDIVVPTNISNLYVATSGPVPPNPAELLGSKAMEDFMERVKSEFDIVVMDTPPLAFVIDSVLMSRYADVTIYVVRQNYTSKDVFKLINDQHFKGNISNLGILINDVKLSPYSYGKQYSYGYIYNYGYGTGNNSYYGEMEEKDTWVKKIRKFLFEGIRIPGFRG